MYSNMKYYENIRNCLRVIQQDINRKLKSANCWRQTSLIAVVISLSQSNVTLTNQVVCLSEVSRDILMKSVGLKMVYLKGRQ